MSPTTIIINLSQNIALLLSLTFAFSFMRPYMNRLHPVIQSVLGGVIFGIFGVIGMLVAVQITPGFILDGRTVMIAVAGAYGGGVPAVIAAIIVSMFRLLVGGAGTVPAIAAAITAAGLGYLVYRYHQSRRSHLNGYTLAVLGIAVAGQRLLWTALLAGVAGQQIATELALPTLVLFPPGTVLLGLLLVHQRRHFEVELALHESEARYRSVVSSMNEGVVLQDAGGSIRACNASAERILGLTVDQMMGHSPVDAQWQIIREDGTWFPSQLHPAMVALQTGQQQLNVVMGIHKPNGSLTWIQMNSQPVMDGQTNKPYAVVTTFSDITEQKTTQEALLHERNLLRTLIDSTPDYIFIKDDRGRFVVSNEAHAQAVHMTSDGLVGLTAFDVFPPELAQQFHKDDLAIMKSGKPLFNLERTTLDAQGEFRTVLTTKVPLRNQEGRVVGLVGTSRDITERKAYEQQRLELAAERQRVEVLQRFIADMSHDFRTPLTIINNSVYLLKKTQDIERQRSHLEKLEAQVARMGHLLDEFLAMENLDKPAQPPQVELVEVNPMIYDVIRSTETAHPDRQHRLEFVLNGDIPLVMGDAAQLHQMMVNVVENAIQNTADGDRITLCTYVEDQWVVVAVQDSGVGISANDLPHIFESFYRADRARSIKTGGSGLGLTIAKKIVEAHNGTIEVQSQVGKGSTFYVRLPAARPEFQMEHPRMASGL